MFGYIKPYFPQMLVCESEYYKAVYCGLCKTIGKKCGNLCRMGLSYDFVFLAVVRMALGENKPVIKKRRCFVHPMKKRNMLLQSETLEYSSLCHALLTYYKNLDDIADKKGAAKIVAKLIYPFARHYHKKAKPLFELDKEIKENMASLSRLECEGASADACAEVFGDLLSCVFSFGISDEKKRRIAQEAGKCTGRFIYLCDACDDIKKDAANGEFNPLGEMMNDDDKKRMETSLIMHASNLARTLELLCAPDVPESGILLNIAYKGMPRVAREVLFGKETNDSLTEELQSDRSL